MGPNWSRGRFRSGRRGRSSGSWPSGIRRWLSCGRGSAAPASWTFTRGRSCRESADGLAADSDDDDRQLLRCRQTRRSHNRS